MVRSALGFPLGVAGRSESFKSMIAGGNHTAQGMSYRVVSVSASPNSLMKLIKEDSLYSGSLAIRFFLGSFHKTSHILSKFGFDCRYVSKQFLILAFWNTLR